MNSNAICVAASAPKFGAIPISGAIWSRCGPPRSRRAIRPRRGGRVSDELPEIFVNVRNPTLPSTLVRTISRTGNQPASRRASTVIDRAWENWPPSSDLQDQKLKTFWRSSCPHEMNTRAQAQVRLQQETPITDDASLLPLQEEAAAIVREAKRRDPSGTDELVSTVLDEVARSYFRHALLHRSAVGRFKLASAVPARTAMR